MDVTHKISLGKLSNKIFYKKQIKTKDHKKKLFNKA